MVNIYKSAAGQQLVEGRYREILAEWPVPNQQYKVPTSLGDTFVIESGDRAKPPLLLLHGSVSNSFAWMGDVARFAETHSVYAIDLVGEPGFSASARPAYQSGAYADWLRDVLDALNLSSASLLGLSLGGWMAMEFATSHPSRVNKLALICPAGLAPTRQSLIFKALFYSLFGKWGQKRIRALINGGPLPDGTGDEKLGIAMDFTSLMGKHFKPRTAKVPMFTDAELGALTMPVLLVFGARDAIVHAAPSVDRMVAMVPQAQVQWLPEAGHLILDQGPTISDFLND